MDDVSLHNDPRAKAARDICTQLRKAGFRALFAGGCVRDALLGIRPRDYDIATDAHVSDICRIFPKTINIGAAYGVAIVVLPQGHFEVTTFRQDGPYLDGRHPSKIQFTTPEEDAKRRDFTINALFYDPETAQILDYVGGQDDLENKLLRAVGDPAQRFQEDHLRLMRAVRFSARLGYPLDPATQAVMKAQAHLIQHTSVERIRDELIKMLTEGGAEKAMRCMEEVGLLPHILPEIAAMKSVEQPAAFHPEGDVFEHTLLMLTHLVTPSPTLAMGALLHDVGKPLTQTFEDRIRFNHHNKVGARLSETICRRLRFSNEQIERIAWLVEQHMRFASIPDMRESRRRRFVREPGFDELLLLCRADCLASHGDLSTVQWVQDYQENLPPESLRPSPLLRGHDLIAMGYAPGPLMGEILHAVEDAQLEDLIGDKTTAQQYVRDHWPHPA